MYTLKEGLRYVYVLLSQHGATDAIGPNQFLTVANMALNFIYSYNGYFWTRQHYSDKFNLIEGNVIHKLITSEPIALVDKFRVTKYPGKEMDLSPCLCPENPEYVCACDCDTTCMPPCEPLDLKRILPHNNLCPGEYQIAGSEIKGMGGYSGRIIKVYLPCKTNSLWVTYYRAPKHMKTFDDVIPLPDTFMHVFGLVCAALIAPIYGVMLQQQDMNWRAIARKELDNFKAADNIAPREIRFSSSYPFEQTPHASSAIYGVTAIN